MADHISEMFENSWDGESSLSSEKILENVSISPKNTDIEAIPFKTNMAIQLKPEIMKTEVIEQRNALNLTTKASSEEKSESSSFVGGAAFLMNKLRKHESFPER